MERKYRTTIFSSIFFLLVSCPLWAKHEEPTELDPTIRFNYAHHGETAYTLPAKTIQLGLGPVAYGVTDFLQIGTDFISPAYGIARANVKLNLFNWEYLGASVGFEYNYLFNSFGYPADLGFRTKKENHHVYLPQASVSVKLSDEVFLHTGGRYILAPTVKNDSQLVYSSVFKNSRVFSDLEIRFSDQKALLVGPAYAYELQGFGGGLSYRISGKDLGYTIQLGASVIFHKGEKMIIDPVIKVVWRL